MGKRVGKRIGLREVRELGLGQTTWDLDVSGFCIRRQKSDAVSYALKYRTVDGRQRWHTIGRHGSPWTPDLARAEARRLLNDVVVNRGDPAGEKAERRKAMDVSALLDEYMKAAESGRILTKNSRPKKASTLYTDRCRLTAHVEPVLGRMKVAAVTLTDVENLLHEIADGTAARARAKPKTGAPARGGRGAATRTIGLLGAVFAYAMKRKLRPDNPVRGIERFRDGQRTRRLSDEEYTMFAAGMADTISPAQPIRGRQVSAISPTAQAAAKFLLLTGWRRSEVLNLTWAEVDLPRRTAKLEDSKTGASMRPLSQAACDVLRGMRGHGASSPSGYVFPAVGTRDRLKGFPYQFARIVMAGGLPPDVTPHLLRHSYASLAGDMGFSEPTIAALVGHRRGTVTSRYIHSADTALLGAADAVADRIVALMNDAAEPGVVVPLDRARVE